MKWYEFQRTDNKFGFVSELNVKSVIKVDDQLVAIVGGKNTFEFLTLTGRVSDQPFPGEFQDITDGVNKRYKCKCGKYEFDLTIKGHLCCPNCKAWYNNDLDLDGKHEA